MQTVILCALFGVCCAQLGVSPPSTTAAVATDRYYGTYVARFVSTSDKGVDGYVFLVDNQRLAIYNFSYNGAGPDAFFWIGLKNNTSATPDNHGIQVPNEYYSLAKLGRYMNQTVVLTLPTNVHVTDIKWLSVWCAQVGVNFGFVTFPSVLPTVPASYAAGSLTSYSNGVTGMVTLPDTMHIQINGLYYDGMADARFLFGNGSISRSSGIIIGDEYGRMDKLHSYSNATVVLAFPPGYQIINQAWICIWDVTTNHTLGSMAFTSLPVIPPNTANVGPYYGEYIGFLSTLAYGVAGVIYAVDDRTLRLRHFYYSGAGPDAHFSIGVRGISKPMPDSSGVYLPDETGSTMALRMYTDKEIFFALPTGVMVSSIMWFSVWCKQATVNFGHVMFRTSIYIPRNVTIGSFPVGASVHNVHSNSVVILDTRTIFIPNLTYDGQGPNAVFWVGHGGTPDANGWTIPNEQGNTNVLHQYTNKNVTLILPSNITVYDIDYVSIWCRTGLANFGHVIIPHAIHVPPYLPMAVMMYDNCEKMSNVFNVAWKVDGPVIHFEFQALLNAGQHMAFGVSGSNSTYVMVGGDVTVAYYDNLVGPHAVDYFLQSRSQCSGGKGVCSDVDAGGYNDVSSVNGMQQNGVTTITFTRPLLPTDPFDKKITLGTPMYIIWSMGPMNSDGLALYHGADHITAPITIDFGRSAANNCPILQPQSGSTVPPKAAWTIPMITGDSMNTVFTAEIGPSGGDKGYAAITGSLSWGIAWYINGYLIPELVLFRHRTYTFNVLGGHDARGEDKNHPFYITDSAIGGPPSLLPSNTRVFAGVSPLNQLGNYTAAGTFCGYMSSATPAQYDSYTTFNQFKATLTRTCDPPTVPATLTWTPDNNTPNLVYYQCFRHKYLGWKIRIMDNPTSPASSGATVEVKMKLLAIIIMSLITILHCLAL